MILQCIDFLPLSLVNSMVSHFKISFCVLEWYSRLDGMCLWPKWDASIGLLVVLFVTMSWAEQSGRTSEQMPIKMSWGVLQGCFLAGSLDRDLERDAELAWGTSSNPYGICDQKYFRAEFLGWRRGFLCPGLRPHIWEVPAYILIILTDVRVSCTIITALCMKNCLMHFVKWAKIPRYGCLIM